MKNRFSLVLVAIFALCLIGCQHSSAQMSKSSVQQNNAQENMAQGNNAQERVTIVPRSLQSTYDDFHYAPAVRVGDMLYLSGVVAKLNDADKGDMNKAIARAFSEIQAVLAEAGASWDDAVDVTSYMTDFDNQIGPLWEVKDQYVNAPYPAWTAIGVDRLFGGDQALIEIKVVAYSPKK